MRAEKLKSDALRESMRRVAALVVAISCHLGLLMLLLRPGVHHPDGLSGVESTTAALQLRFISPPMALPAHTTVSTFAVTKRLAGPERGTPVMVKASFLRVAHEPVVRSEHLPGGAVTANASSVSASPTPAAESTRTETTFSDGGFQQRLLNAESSGHVRGVPGSDRRQAPGIQLTDPMNQGVGALMRNTQRLFGVTNRHCIDVEVWRSLTPEERISRHISSGERTKIEEEYKCDKPLGLSF
ncbi:hypothetical protein [Luteibacter yeojuensis]